MAKASWSCSIRSRRRPSSKVCGTSSCPTPRPGEGLSNLDYAYIAIELGKNPIAPECLNCSAPDTGNMEVLERVGTDEQKAQWLEPLLHGEIRSAYAMSEPDVPSSDAKNIACRAVRDGNEWVIDGEKYYISGAGDPRCKIMIVMVQTDPDGPPHRRQSQILVPMDTPGVEIVGPMHVFGDDDAPHGHMHLRFTGVRVPDSNMLLGEGRGFEISQVRLGPGRIHHCMRSIGAAEKALELMAKRGIGREAFGKRIANLGRNIETLAKARIEIEAMRRMVLTAAKAMDELGNAEARVWVSAVKAMVPIRVCEIVDEAIQVHGAAGISQWTPLAGMYTWQRALRAGRRSRRGALVRRRPRRTGELGADRGRVRAQGRVLLQLAQRFGRGVLRSMTPAANPGGVVGFDVPTIEEWLRAATDIDGQISWTCLPGGHSNLTYLLPLPWLELADRRPPQGERGRRPTTCGGYRVIDALWPTEVPVAEPIAYCDDRSVAETHFYVMGKIEGQALYTGTTTAAWLDEPARRRAGESFIDVLAALHSLNPDIVGLGDLGPADGYIARQLRTWYGSWTASVAAANYDDRRVHDLHDQFSASIPVQVTTRIVHGDHGPHNSLFSRSGDLQGVLDWEIATLGDPLADFAYSINTWAEPADGLTFGDDPATVLPGFPNRQDLIDRYQRATGCDLSNLAYYRAFNAWKSACVLLGVYARYRAGNKSTAGVDVDELFARMILLIDLAASLTAELAN